MIMRKDVIIGTIYILVILTFVSVYAISIEFLISVPDKIFYPNETIPINVSVSNKDVSGIIRNGNLTVNISKRTYIYNLGNIEPSDSVIKNIELPEFPPGDYIIHGVLEYTGFFDENAMLETFNSFHVRFPEIERLPRNIVIKGFEVTSDIIEGETHSVSVEVANEGQVTGNLIIKIEGLGVSGSKATTLSSGQTENVAIDVEFYNSGISVIEARVYAIVDDVEYLLSFDTKSVFVKSADKANIVFDSLELIEEADNQINQNDEVRIKIGLKNTGSTMTSNVNAILTSTNNNVEIVESDANYNVILADNQPVHRIFSIKTNNAEVGIVSLDMNIDYTDLSGSNSIALRIPIEINEGADTCFNNNDCLSNEICSDNRCEELTCDCGYAKNHECIGYECCNDSDCPQLYTCDTKLHTCKSPECTNDLDCDDNEVCNNGKCEKAKLILAYIPVNWDVPIGDFDSEVDSQSNFLIENLPLSKCSERVKIVKIHESCNYQYSDEPSCRDLVKIKNCANRWTTVYDYLIGIDSSYGAYGLTLAGYSCRIGTVYTKKGSKVVVAHELGHEWGLVDEYCWNPPENEIGPNPTTPELGCDYINCCGGWIGEVLAAITGMREYCKVRFGTTAFCLGNVNRLGGRAIMASADSLGPRAYDNLSMIHLSKNSQLTC